MQPCAPRDSMRGHAEQAHSRGVKLALGPSSSGFEKMTHEANRSPILSKVHDIISTSIPSRHHLPLLTRYYQEGTTFRAASQQSSGSPEGANHSGRGARLVVHGIAALAGRFSPLRLQLPLGSGAPGTGLMVVVVVVVVLGSLSRHHPSLGMYLSRIFNKASHLEA